MENTITAFGLGFEQNEIAAALENINGIQVEFLIQCDLKNKEKNCKCLNSLKKLQAW